MKHDVRFFNGHIGSFEILEETTALHTILRTKAHSERDTLTIRSYGNKLFSVLLVVWYYLGNLVRTQNAKLKLLKYYFATPSPFLGSSVEAYAYNNKHQTSCLLFTSPKAKGTPFRGG